MRRDPKTLYAQLLWTPLMVFVLMLVNWARPEPVKEKRTTAHKTAVQNCFITAPLLLTPRKNFDSRPYSAVKQVSSVKSRYLLTFPV